MAALNLLTKITCPEDKSKVNEHFLMAAAIAHHFNNKLQVVMETWIMTKYNDRNGAFWHFQRCKNIYEKNCAKWSGNSFYSRW